MEAHKNRLAIVASSSRTKTGTFGSESPVARRRLAALPKKRYQKLEKRDTTPTPKIGIVKPNALLFRLSSSLVASASINMDTGTNQTMIMDKIVHKMMTPKVIPIRLGG